MSSNNILNSLRSSNLVNALQEVAASSDTPMYESAVGMSAIKNVSANISVLPVQEQSLISGAYTNGQELQGNINRVAFLHAVQLNFDLQFTANSGTSTLKILSMENGGAYPLLTKCDIVRGSQVIFPMNGISALCYMSKYLEGDVVDRMLEASMGGQDSIVGLVAAGDTAVAKVSLLIPYDFTFDKSLALDTTYIEQMLLRVQFSDKYFGDIALPTGATAVKISNVTARYHHFDLDPDVTSQLRKNVYASADAHSFLVNGWNVYGSKALTASQPDTVNLSSQNLVKHVFYLEVDKAAATSGQLTEAPNNTQLMAGGQILFQHTTQSDRLIQNIIYAPKSNVLGNVLQKRIACFDLTDAQHTEADSYSGGMSLRNMADPKINIPSGEANKQLFVVECYYNLVSVTSASGQIMVASTT